MIAQVYLVDSRLKRRVLLQGSAASCTKRWFGLCDNVRCTVYATELTEGPGNKMLHHSSNQLRQRITSIALASLASLRDFDMSSSAGAPAQCGN